MNAAARADAYRRQTGRTPCTLAAFWTNEDHTRGFAMRCGARYNGIPREEIDDLEAAHQCWRRRDLTPRQARRDRHKTNRAKRPPRLDATPPAVRADATPGGAS